MRLLRTLGNNYVLHGVFFDKRKANGSYPISYSIVVLRESAAKDSSIALVAFYRVQKDTV